MLKFKKDAIEELLIFSESLVLTEGQKKIKYVVQGMFNQMVNRIDIDSRIAYAFLWKAIINYHEENKLEYIHGNEMTPYKRRKRTMGTLLKLQEYMCDSLEREEDKKRIREAISSMYEEYCLLLANR